MSCLQTKVMGAVYRTALGHVIGGDFISHLMQVTVFFFEAAFFTHCSRQHFTAESSTFKALITSFFVLQASVLQRF